MILYQHAILAASLCMDCFAVAICASTSIKKFKWQETLKVAVVFSFFHVVFLLTGWASGSAISGFVSNFANYLGFALLAFVGISMVVEALRGEESALELNSNRNIIIAAFADSLDALAVGVTMSITEEAFSEALVTAACLIVFTVLTVVVGMYGGTKIGRRFGGISEIIGGVVLLLIGVNIAFPFV